MNLGWKGLISSCIFARDKTQKLLRTLLTYRLLQRRELNWRKSNCIPGFPLHLLRPPLSFPGPSALRKKNHSHYFWDWPHISDSVLVINELVSVLSVAILRQFRAVLRCRPAVQLFWCQPAKGVKMLLELSAIWCCKLSFPYVKEFLLIFIIRNLGMRPQKFAIPALNRKFLRISVCKDAKVLACP